MNGERIIRKRKEFLSYDTVDFCNWLMKELEIDFTSTLIEDYDSMESYEVKEFRWKGKASE